MLAQSVSCLWYYRSYYFTPSFGYLVWHHRYSSQWFRSYLLSRTSIVAASGFKSSSFSASCGVPQGSVLGPLLYIMYTTPLSSFISNSPVSHHLYADDTQLYLSFSSLSFTSNIAQLQSVIAQVSSWMSSNLLSLNPNKTEFLVIGTPQQLSKLNNLHWS